VKQKLHKKMPSSSHLSSRLFIGDLKVEMLRSNSSYILSNIKGVFRLSFEEKATPDATEGSSYGLSPTITTFNFSKGTLSNISNTSL
jgi:hypothetical protein